ncbi:MAG: sulfatase-like hydrolase/transferase [Pirellulales bacterium]
MNTPYRACLRNWLRVAWFSLLFIAFPRSLLAGERPNVLFLFADDFTYEAIRSLGKVDIETPNLDRIASRGTAFTHAYNMGSWSGAVCVASRHMLITGRSVWRAEAASKRADAEREAGRIWPIVLKQAGYDTYMTGKWHIQTPADRCFDVVRHVRGGMPSTVEAAYHRPEEGVEDRWSPSDPSLGGFWEGGKHWSEVTADDAIDFLKLTRDQSNPFFMYVAFNAPHDPRQSPREYLEKYPLDRIVLPKSFQPLYPYKDDIGCGKSLRDEQLAPFPRTEYSVRVHRREYYALITHLDAQIGRVLDALEASGKADNTWIFFTADHGLAVGHHGLMGKQNMYEHSLRVPFLVVDPRSKKQQSISAPIYLQDVMTTSLELAGVSKPEWTEFHSVLPLMQGKRKTSYYPEIYGAYLGLQRCVIDDHWKLIVYPKSKTVRLYNLQKDPLEMEDLAASPRSQERIRKLFAKLQMLQSRYDDRLKLEESFPELVTSVAP